MRHRVGQLDSVKAVPYEELEMMRTETEQKLKMLEEQYWGKKDATHLNNTIRDKYKQYSTTDNSEADTAVATPGPGKSSEKLGSKPGILKSSTPGGPGSLAKPKFDGGRVRSKSGTKKQRSPSPLDYSGDPRQQIYEAKFEKFLANKKTKKDHDVKRQSMVKEDFDLYTKGFGSPSKSSKRCKPRPDPTAPSLSGKYNPDELLASGTGRLSEAELLKAQQARADPFGALGVGSADKMTFFLLKWVFNAIKRDSADDDPHFKGESFISKSDLIKQLAKNPELLRALGYEDQRQL